MSNTSRHSCRSYQLKTVSIVLAASTAAVIEKVVNVRFDVLKSF